MRIDDAALADLALGAAFLGSGGGGDPYYGRLLGQAELDRHGPIELIALDELADDALIAPCGWIGAPTVSVEKLPSGREVIAGLRRLERLMGRPIAGVLPVEIGGGNGLAPLVAAAQLGVPRQAREVGEACAANRLAVVVPCHRVIKKDGSISGYRWGVRRKRTLLERESRARSLPLFAEVAHHGPIP